ncbi:TIGR02300 family protein [Actibacterium sp. 188UL27-1]|uniref:TIGR02300 family protein n=1 Tax=Actibacterium sp. 188UL27-1 TaxID=2786961 RepID=UPI00195DD0D4|nr:TIGR02300 family protein [Actibacterium sp. 188UL27-1]MBM7068342.1 TIGR02300 family protein [Actibacterium sp. 188UL27-1]
MPKEEWGVKRLCPTTGKRFYDLGRDPIVSPYTGEVVTLDTGTKSRVQIKEVKAEKPAATEEEDVLLPDSDGEVLEDDDDTSDVDLADDVLDEDDDDNVSLDEIADVPADDDDS